MPGRWLLPLRMRSASPAQLLCYARDRYVADVGPLGGRQHGGSCAEGAPLAAGASPHQLVQCIALTYGNPLNDVTASGYQKLAASHQSQQFICTKLCMHARRLQTMKFSLCT